MYLAMKTLGPFNESCHIIIKPFHYHVFQIFGPFSFVSFSLVSECHESSFKIFTSKIPKTRFINDMLTEIVPRLHIKPSHTEIDPVYLDSVTSMLVTDVGEKM